MALSAFCCAAPLSEVLRCCINGACAPTCWVPGRTRLCCVVHLRHMWLWVNKSSPGSSGCSDMFWPRRHDSYSLSNACRVNGWQIRSAIYFYTKMTLKRRRESDYAHTNLILSLFIQTWVITFKGLIISCDLHLLYLSYSWGSCLVHPPPLPSFLVPSVNLRNPVSIANPCCFHP